MATSVQQLVTEGLLVILEAQPGREEEVAGFLESALPLVEEEPGTAAWFAIRLGPSAFGIFDVFPDDSARDAPLNGKVAAAQMERAEELFCETPNVQKLDVLAAKLPVPGID
jgi:hypothetical protein